MINQIYRLVSTKQIEITYKEQSLEGDYIVVRPTHLSICAADQRYYTGTRGKEAMAKKLPMALIHEGVGKVVYDPKGEFKTGTHVVMIPNTPTQVDDVIAENYLKTSKFRSSGYDGFMQDYVFLERDRVVGLSEDINLQVAAFSELISVSMHAIVRFEERAHKRRDVLGVWGDGNLGFITALILKKRYPESKVYVFGKNHSKLSYFSFADETYQIDEVPEDVTVDHAFECVGGIGSQYAVEQIINHIQPEGSIPLLGVSEYPVEINTRMILERGITLIGSSRSGRSDFVETVNFLHENPEVVEYLETLIGDVNEIRSIDDIHNAFERDLTTNWGKSVMEWKI
ncbi:ribitol-5-phosphate dehydrogenase [Bacillus sp. AFS055030]|uniref:ribitol-5-phosphate dehydrogenase n=1 Tax=Bacillus sp. AFS055030 TaxID=2033507 RepID=UPI000BFB79F6|nr:ribitol-5-phosphate dehydrogenase [Bacillus sp. AFS055030]PGL69603.1 ribitol-5-phosphate dehydrogenase [Bacillus sp. AFS055030]